MKDASNVKRGFWLAILLPLFVISGGHARDDLAGRHISLEGQPNFRDVGGYRTADGRMVKRGMVYRSGELPRLSDGDVARLGQLGIRTVVNFLTEEEIAYRGRDRLPAGVRTISLPISGGEAGQGGDKHLTSILVEARKTGDFRKIPAEINQDIHGLLVRGVADTQYAELFRVLSDLASYPLVFHCSHGVHRTGTATALLLSALGVPWETVRGDYLLSNVTREREVGQRITQLEKLAGTVDMGDRDRAANSANIRAFYVLEGSYIDATLTSVEAKYGSMAGYLRDGLGLAERDLQKLRKLLLQ